MEAVTKPGHVVAPPARKHGQGLLALVEVRRKELELELAEIQKGGPGKAGDLEAALGALEAMLTGDLDQIPPMVAQALNQWMQTSRFLGEAERAAREKAKQAPAAPGPEPTRVLG